MLALKPKVVCVRLYSPSLLIIKNMFNTHQPPITQIQKSELGRTNCIYRKLVPSTTAHESA